MLLLPCMLALAGSPWVGTAVVKDAAAIVGKMSFEEKFSMIYGRNIMPPKGPIPKEYYYVGNVPATPRLGLPSINLEDGPQGVADGLTNVTMFPSQLTVACTWSRDLMQAYGAAMGAEQAAKGTNVMLGPDVNLARVPWSGRVFETMGEDPFLASQLVAPLIHGIQSNNISACIKHYIFNNHEVNRVTVSSNVGDRTGRELYAPAFFAAVDAGVGSVMCAFNRVNNTYSCESPGALSLLKDPTAGGFRGWVVTDWGAQHDSIASALAGLDQQMEYDAGAVVTRDGTIGFNTSAFRKALLNGTIPMSRLNDMVTRMVEPMLALGMKDHQPNKATQNTASIARTAAHLKLAAELASKSIVLLKNKGGILPLLESKRNGTTRTDRDTVTARRKMPSVALFGNPWFRAGSGSGGVQYSPTGSAYTVSACKADAGCNVNTAYISQILYNGGITDMTLGRDNAQAGIKPFAFNASKAAREAAAKDVAVVIVYQTSGEGRDRHNISADDWQNEMVATVAAANPNTIVVLRTPGATAMPWLDQVAAVLYQLYPGQAGGVAAGGAILGTINPSGKLPVSFPTSIDETWLGNPRLNPAQYPGTVRGNTWQEADYTEELEVGYRWYDAEQQRATTAAGNGGAVGAAAAAADVPKPLFPFGFGMSFTTFKYSALKASATTSTFAITNTGKVAGAEIAQLYVAFPTSAGLPPKQLKGFERVDLNPGQTVVVTVTLGESDLKTWSVGKGAWESVHGVFTVEVGASAADILLKATFTA